MNKLSLADIEYSDLEFKETVGSGGFGTVFKGRWISQNKTVAIKMMMVLVEREVSYNNKTKYFYYVQCDWSVSGF